ncbi:Uncharacterized mitochondrial carrier C8C9.12c [Seminavis robusta]|uniref:Uncharacterized mitochondrial carrier C8C9.12c n=1 Tax=Seminavis robusta TaxID=568900 RepID=A0A9N8HH70_9STRA|nr:Uncharacterized mitochondrial carrier C8C9.12c [Seminavis robusta]|eukprot:Sro434_g141970.1 Uncharacterized mitochondrial carrier C8C9.12c (375) ;mRNA; r:9821-10945
MSDIDEDWEEWDGKSPFWHHCVAGSTAGLAEHTLVYPLDTVRTHIQVCANCKFSPSYQQQQVVKSTATAMHHPSSQMRGRMPLPPQQGKSHTLPQGMWQTMRFLMSEPAVLADAATTTTAEPPKPEGIMRLWRGVQTVMIGCVPAHAIYFSSYEMVKAFFTNNGNAELAWYGGMMAGATATLGHDMIMAPLDTVKQRLQIGHYRGSMSFALQQMVQKEGMVALYRSFPITLFANLPYGMIMVSTNETLKQMWTDNNHQPLTLSTTLMASAAAGFVASAATTPLDRIKTLLQTQQMAPACWPTPPAHCPQKINVASEERVVRTGYQALQHILKQEGAIGLFRGLVPRVMSHTPAVAISWTTYETAKSVLWKVTQQ